MGCLGARHSVEDGQQLAHGGDEGELSLFSSGNELLVEGGNYAITLRDDKGRHVGKHAA
jgi:hypothetical protein